MQNKSDITAVPDGCMEDARGAFIRVEKIKPEHLLEDELVNRLAESARSVRGAMTAFKQVAFEDVDAFRDIIAEKYGAQKGGKKGNITLRSFDGKAELQVAVSDHIAFGPELQAAKKLIDGCVERWAAESSDNIRALINHAFQVDKAGKTDTRRVLELRRLDIQDPDWKLAMDAIADAVRVTSSRTYMRFYDIEPDTGARAPISLDFASL